MPEDTDIDEQQDQSAQEFSEKQEPKRVEKSVKPVPKRPVHVAHKANKKHPSHHAEHKTPKKNKTLFVDIAVIVIIAVAVVIAAKLIPKGTPSFVQNMSSEKIKVDFHVMSQCPYGTQVEDAVKPVIDQLSDNVEFSINFIGDIFTAAEYAQLDPRQQAQCTLKEDGNYYCSLHGKNEVDGNLVQVCVMQYYPDAKTFMQFITCQNENAGAIPANWEGCAKAQNLDVEKIKACYEGTESKELLAASFQRAAAANAQGSPTIIIDGQSYAGGRQSNDFLKAFCNELTDKPEACANIPPPINVNLIVMSDKRCAECEQAVAQIVPQLKSLFPGLVVESKEFMTAQAEYDQLGITALPVMLFDDSITQGEGYAQISSYLEQKGQYWSLRIGASFNPKGEICDNNIDDLDKDSKIDCADDECSGTLVCRPEKEQQLDLFVMSQCPYGITAMNSMNEVLQNFPNMKFSINFIASENADGSFSSLHGQAEVQENIRELCVMNYYPENYTYMDYIWCRNKAITSTAWESCATSNSMDAAKIKTCSEGDEGKLLLSENIKLARQLNIGSSPTWLANNKQTFSGLDANAIKAGFCSANPGIAGCENVLSQTAAPSTSGPSC